MQMSKEHEKLVLHRVIMGFTMIHVLCVFGMLISMVMFVSRFRRSFVSHSVIVVVFVLSVSALFFLYWAATLLSFFFNGSYSPVFPLKIFIPCSGSVSFLISPAISLASASFEV